MEVAKGDTGGPFVRITAVWVLNGDEESALASLLYNLEVIDRQMEKVEDFNINDTPLIPPNDRRTLYEIREKAFGY